MSGPMRVPETVESDQDKVEALEPIAESGRMANWEIEFVADLCAKIGGGGPLTSTQSATLDKIYRQRVLGE